MGVVSSMNHCLCQLMGVVSRMNHCLLLMGVVGLKYELVLSVGCGLSTNHCRLMGACGTYQEPSECVWSQIRIDLHIGRCGINYVLCQRVWFIKRVQPTLTTQFLEVFCLREKQECTTSKTLV